MEVVRKGAWTEEVVERVREYAIWREQVREWVRLRENREKELPHSLSEGKEEPRRVLELARGRDGE